MPIRTLLFDAGGTLVFPNWSRIRDEFAREGVDVTVEALARAEARVRVAFDSAEVVARTADGDRWRLYVSGIAREAGIGRVPGSALERLRAYHDAHNLWESMPPEIPSLLDRLRERYRLGLVSNSNGTVRAKFERLGLAKAFEVLVDSHEEGVEKPDPRLFRIALDRMGCDPAQTAYIGDLYHVDVVGARAAGLRAILFDPLDLHGDKDCPRVRSLVELLDGRVFDGDGPFPQARG